MTYEGRSSPANSRSVGSRETLGRKRVAINIRHGIRQMTHRNVRLVDLAL